MSGGRHRQDRRRGARPLAGLGSVFIDTSILIGGSIELAPDPDDAHRLMAAIAADRLERPSTAWHCCLEFFSVATRLPEEYRLAPEDALRLIEQILAHLVVLDLPAAERPELLRALASERVTGGRIYDHHIGAVAMSGGARVVVTENVRHFTHLARRGVRVLRAGEILAEIE